MSRISKVTFAVEENMRAGASFHGFTISFPGKASCWFEVFLVSCLCFPLVVLFRFVLVFVVLCCINRPI